VVNAGYDPYGFVLELADATREELLKAGGSDRLFLQATLSVLLSLLERMRRHPAPDLLAETELIKITLLPQLIEVERLAKEISSLKAGRARSDAPREKVSPARPKPPAQRKEEGKKGTEGPKTAPELWNRLLATVGEETPSLKPYLSTIPEGEVSLKGNTLVVNLSSANGFAQQMLKEAQPKLNGLLDQIASGLTLSLEETGGQVSPEERVEKGAKEAAKEKGAGKREKEPPKKEASEPRVQEEKPPEEKNKRPGRKESKEELLERVRREPAVTKALSLFMGKIVSLEDLSKRETKGRSRR